MALQDDVTKFLADLDTFRASPSWLGAVQLTMDGAAIIKDIAGGQGKMAALAPAAVQSVTTKAKSFTGISLGTLASNLRTEIGLPNINWQNVLSIMLAILQAIGPFLLKA